ncbi:MAG: Leucine-rich repeat (LRR) protein [Cellvibrionaceae bacterium]|jgi:Leucine-rich repeat (LRR) protein
MTALEIILENIASKDPVLELGGLDLSALPPELRLATHVTRLSLRGNMLETFPLEITALINLTFLSVADNKISEIPAEISQLINLTRLNLKNNLLTELPLELLELDQLHLLRLDGNQLDLPADILRKWDRPADIVAYYKKHCIPEPEPVVLSIERKIAIFFNNDTLLRLADMLCVPAEELNAPDHDKRAEQFLAYHTEHGLRAELIDLLEVYRPGVFNLQSK